METPETPHQALRRLETLFATTDVTPEDREEAEACFQRLWNLVLKGE